MLGLIKRVRVAVREGGLRGDGKIGKSIGEKVN